MKPNTSSIPTYSHASEFNYGLRVNHPAVSARSCQRWPVNYRGLFPDLLGFELSSCIESPNHLTTIMRVLV